MEHSLIFFFFFFFFESTKKTADSSSISILGSKVSTVHRPGIVLVASGGVSSMGGRAYF